MRDIFSAIQTGNASRIVFGTDGMVYMTVGVGDPPAAARAQDPNDLSGKVLRLRDDGTVPPDNPFVKRTGYRPEILHHGPSQCAGSGGSAGLRCNLGVRGRAERRSDEINILQPGKNYGWPVVSFGRFYLGPRVTEKPWQEGMEPPLVFWVPAIAISGMTFYTGDKFPNWKNNVFVGGMRQGVKFPAPAILSALISTVSGRSSTASRSFGNSSSVSGMSGRGRTDSSTCLRPKMTAR